MGKAGKVTTLLLVVVLATSSLMAIKSASGTSNLSAPEFTVKLVAYPYNVPTTCTVDPITGEKITHQGYQEQNCSIEITIKNPAKNMKYLSYFEIQTKNHDSENWHTLDGHYNIQPPNFAYLASSEEYTVVSCNANYTVGTKLDFQVKAYYGNTMLHDTPGYPLRSYSTFEVIASSLWSLTQTITLGTPEIHVATPASSETSAPTVTQTPTEASAQPITQKGILLGINLEQTIIAILCITGAGLTVTLAFSRKHLKNKEV